ncbi:MAG: mechanosensitive ion channel [Pseudomonadota bacterium]|nr:mechanosensitive ion channel [Pseudomonadota bacterium]
MNRTEHIENLLLNLTENLGNRPMLIELAVLAALAALSWLLMSTLRTRTEAISEEKQLIHLSPSEWGRLGFPAFLLPMILVGRVVLGHWQDVHLFNLALPLLGSFFAIQAVLHGLRRVFQPGRTLLSLQRAVSWLVWGALVLHITGYLAAVIAALDGIGFSVGKQHLSLYTALVGLLSLGALITLALWLSKLVGGRLATAMPDNINLRLALSKMTHGLLLVVAILIALPLVGIDITVLSVFGGALGVGLGLGLQKIAANYVSGFTLLLDQSIRIGDMVTVGQYFGEITQIATRYTVIRSQDGTENIVPNDTLITSAVVNHTLANRDNRMMLQVPVAYGSDLKLAQRVMLEALAKVGGTLVEPKPQVQLTSFGDNGINLDLVFWNDHPEAGMLKLRSDINWAIWEGFQREGIEIPYPQRVVHLAGAANNPASTSHTSPA